MRENASSKSRPARRSLRGRVAAPMAPCATKSWRCRGPRTCKRPHRKLSWIVALFKRDFGRADHLSQFLGFVGNEPSEISRRALDRSTSKVGELRFHLGIGERRVDLLV